MTLYLASGNLHKKHEMQDICRPHTILIPADKGIAFNPEETGKTFFENSLIKARTLWEIIREPVLAEDSGICIDILGGRPGIYSARYAGIDFPYGKPDGIGIPQEQKNKLLLDEVKKAEQSASLSGTSEVKNGTRSCRYVCAMVLYFGKDRFYCVQETMEGSLIEDISEERGKGGFGYDPIVFLSEYGKTVAELSDEEKNAVSHRGKAARKILQLL